MDGKEMVDELIAEWKVTWDRRLKRYSLILKKTKSKRIRKKTEYNLNLATRMVNSIEEVIAMRKQYFG